MHNNISRNVKSRIKSIQRITSEEIIREVEIHNKSIEKLTTELKLLLVQGTKERKNKKCNHMIKQREKKEIFFQEGDNISITNKYKSKKGT